MTTKRDAAYTVYHEARMAIAKAMDALVTLEVQGVGTPASQQAASELTQARRLVESARRRVLRDQKLAEHAEITSSDQVCDAGCGVGGSAVFLAKTFGCRVHGITLGGNQVITSRENASRQGVEHLVAFSRQDYLDTRFPSDTFDVVWAIESVCYAVDKKDFLEEAYRILKPGGRLAVADFFSFDARTFERHIRTPAERHDSTVLSASAESPRALVRDPDIESGTDSVHFLSLLRDRQRVDLFICHCHFPSP